MNRSQTSPPELPKREALQASSAVELLSLARKLQKNEAKWDKAALSHKKIALIGSCNLHFLAEALRPFLLADGFVPEFYEGGVRSYPESLINPHSDLVKFQPDIVISVNTWRDIRSFPALLASADEVTALAQAYLDEQYGFWNQFHRSCPAMVLQSNLVLPPRHLLGQLEANVPYGRDAMLRRINALGVLSRPSFLFYTDFDSFAADYGKQRWFDESAWFLNKQPFAMDALPVAAAALSSQIAAAFGVSRKCLVVDLDNTLWGGIIGDDGLDGINLDPNNALGEAFLDFQHTLKAFRERGILLAVCSKNEENIARSAFQHHPNMVLQLEDFAVFIANWQPKFENLLTIAHQLNINPDALVFFDDNPAEREAVRMALPMVSVVEVPEDPALYSRALFQGNFFEPAQLSKEDLQRTESLRADSQRTQLQQTTLDYDDYLEALEMKASFAAVSEAEIPRFTQLINKTNQFNFRTMRYNESMIIDWATATDVRLYRVTMEDRFSRYGLIAALIVRLNSEEKSAFLDSWVMSCRVFQRELEAETLNKLVSALQGEGIETLKAEYIPTPKNGLIAELLPTLGFAITGKSDSGTAYELDLSSFSPIPTKIRSDSQG
jgi:FkbH-like protein